MPFTNDLEDISHFYKLYEDLMEFFRKKFPEIIYDIEYLKLVENPEIEIQKLLNFCEQNCYVFVSMSDEFKKWNRRQQRGRIFFLSEIGGDTRNFFFGDRLAGKKNGFLHVFGLLGDLPGIHFAQARACFLCFIMGFTIHGVM